MSFSVSRNRSFSCLSFAMGPLRSFVPLEPVAPRLVPRRSGGLTKRLQGETQTGTIFHMPVVAPVLPLGFAGTARCLLGRHERIPQPAIELCILCYTSPSSA